MKKILILLSIFCFISLTACGKIDVKKDSQNIKNEYLYVEKSPDVFTDQVKKLADYMDITAVGFKLNYTGSKKYIEIGYDLLENGKIRKDLSSLIFGIQVDDIPDDNVNNNHLEREITIACQDVINNDKPSYKVTVSGPTSTIKNLYIPKLSIENIAITHEKIGTKEIPKDKEGILWGIIAQKMNTLPGIGIEEQAKRARWAILFKAAAVNDLPDTVI